MPALKARWRNMHMRDITAICALAEQAHPDLPERPAVFAEKQRLAPASCFTLENTANHKIIGYIFAHPWKTGSIAEYDHFLQKLPTKPDILFLHDFVLAPEARGHRLSYDGLTLLSAYMQIMGLNSIALVAVNDTASFWQKHGFVEQPVDNHTPLAKQLAHYGKNAVFMIKKQTA